MPRMRCVWIVLEIVFSFGFSAGSLRSAPPGDSGTAIPWSTDDVAGMRTAKETNRPVLIHFHASWCGPCRQMESQVFMSSDVRSRLRTSFISLKIDSDQRPDMISRYGIDALPADLLLDPNGKVISRSTGAVSREAYLRFLERAPQVSVSPAVRNEMAKSSPSTSQSQGLQNSTFIPIEKPASSAGVEKSLSDAPAVNPNNLVPLRNSASSVPSRADEHPVTGIGSNGPLNNQQSVHSQQTEEKPANSRKVIAKTPDVPSTLHVTNSVVITLQLVPVVESNSSATEK